MLAEMAVIVLEALGDSLRNLHRQACTIGWVPGESGRC